MDASAVRGNASVSNKLNETDRQKCDSRLTQGLKGKPHFAKSVHSSVVTRKTVPDHSNASGFYSKHIGKQLEECYWNKKHYGSSHSPPTADQVIDEYSRYSKLNEGRFMWDLYRLGVRNTAKLLLRLNRMWQSSALKMLLLLRLLRKAI